MSATRNCANPKCQKSLPAGLRPNRIYCDRKCRKSAEHARIQAMIDRARRNSLGEVSPTDQDDMEKEQLPASMLDMGSAPLPSTHNQYLDHLMSLMQENNRRAVEELRNKEGRIESLSRSVIEKDKQIDALNREVERLEERKEDKGGLGGLLENFKDNEGKMDWMGVSTVLQGLATGASTLLGRGPVPMAGTPEIPLEVSQEVHAFADWFVRQPMEVRQNAWSVIQAMSFQPEIIATLLNVVHHAPQSKTAAKPTVKIGVA